MDFVIGFFKIHLDDYPLLFSLLTVMYNLLTNDYII